jgi:hypothetical protein
MDYFTTRNTVILALVQVGVIVFGVLTAGAAVKWYTTLIFLRPPTATICLAEYGALALVLPVGWLTAALRMKRRGADTDSAQWIIFSSGILLLLVLLLGVVYAAVGPLFRLMASGGDF